MRDETLLRNLPAVVRVIGTCYSVDLGPAFPPRIHLVDKQRRCSCDLGATCPAIEAVAEYLHNGGQRAPNPLPACPICGAETIFDPHWDGKFTKERGWRCKAGGLTHFLQAKAERIKEALHRNQTAVSEHESAAVR